MDKNLAFLRGAGIPDEIVEVLEVHDEHARVRWPHGTVGWVRSDRLNFDTLIHTDQDRPND